MDYTATLIGHPHDARAFDIVRPRESVTSGRPCDLGTECEIRTDGDIRNYVIHELDDSFRPHLPLNQ